MAEAEVDRALCICTTLEEFDDVHALAMGYDNFWCSVGVHPDSEDVREPALDDLLALAQRPRVVAVGETGLDYFRDYSPRSAQIAAFERQLAIAIDTGKPLFLHQRDAHDDFVPVDVVKRYW